MLNALEKGLFCDWDKDVDDSDWKQLYHDCNNIVFGTTSNPLFSNSGLLYIAMLTIRIENSHVMIVKLQEKDSGLLHIAYSMCIKIEYFATDQVCRYV